MDNKQAAKRISENLTSFYGYAFARLYDKNDVDDLTSEIVYEILRSSSRLSDESAFWAFAWKIAENTFRKFIRRKERSGKAEPLPEDIELPDTAPTPEEAYIEKESAKESIFLLRRELSLLSQTHREVSVAYYIHHKTCSEIAKEQHISVDMVKYHLFKTRKLLKEGIGMTRNLGEKSYNPGVFRINFWGDRNYYIDLFHRKLPGSIMLAAYDIPMTAQELSVELGVAMPYLEEELAILVKAGVLLKTGEKYRTNLVILTGDYEQDFDRRTKNFYKATADALYEKAAELLPTVRKLSFEGNDSNDNCLLWLLLNITMMQGYYLANETSPMGEPKKWPLGGCGFLHGLDNNYTYRHFSDICTDKNAAAWFTAVNYTVIEPCQKYLYEKFDRRTEAMCAAIRGEKADERNDTIPELIAGGFIRCTDGVLKARFLVFDESTFSAVTALLKGMTEKVSALMIETSDMGEKLLREYVPDSVKDQCGDIAKIYHRLNTMAFLMESLVADGKLTVPHEPTPLGVYGVKV